MNEATGELEQDLPSLVEAQGHCEAALEEVERQIAAIEAPHSALYEQRKLLKAAVKAGDEALRQAVVNAADALGTNHPYGPCHVQYRDKVLFDAEKMRQWAYENAPGLLVLDEVRVRRDFKKLHGAPLEVAKVPVAVIDNLAAWTAPLGAPGDAE